MDRREFVGLLGTAPGVALSRRIHGHLSIASNPRASALVQRHPLPIMPIVSGDELTLTAGRSMADLGVFSSEVWALNDLFPAPVIRLHKGRRANITLVNDLAEPTILHWHGLNVPQEADGHPRLAIDPGASYHYEFRVSDRPGTYWYHPHTHRRTAAQTYMGMAGLLLVAGEEEAALALPSGDREVPLILQDKRIGGGRSLEYEMTMGPDMMMGCLGDTAFGNGVIDPTLDVMRGQYRLRILNASNARIFDLGLSNGSAFTLIGTDGGLLAAPVRVERLMLATGERADVLIDFSARAPGERIMLRSVGFEVPGMMMGMGMGRGMGRGRMMGGVMQGAAMDLLEFVVSDSTPEMPQPLPARLSELPSLEKNADLPQRTFRFNSMMMNHTINGRQFDMERVDVRVKRGEAEVWTLINDSEVPHPVHIHAGQFHVISRTGGRDRVMPWETGLKDTVLLFPREQVDVAVRFDDHLGVFLLHCHNLEHEDLGMMLNFEITE